MIIRIIRSIGAWLSGRGQRRLRHPAGRQQRYGRFNRSKFRLLSRPKQDRDDYVEISLPRRELVNTLNRTLSHSCGQSSMPAAECDHPDVVKSLADAAYLCECQGRFAEAERLYKQTIQLTARRLGETAFEQLPFLMDLTNFYRQQARYSSAIASLRKVLVIRQQHQNPQHPDIASTLEQLRHFQKQLTQLNPVDLQKEHGPDADTSSPPPR